MKSCLKLSRQIQIFAPLSHFNTTVIEVLQECDQESLLEMEEIMLMLNHSVCNCWTIVSYSDIWHNAGIKFQVFLLPGSWVRLIRKLNAESCVEDGEFQRDGVTGQFFFPLPNTKLYLFPSFERDWPLLVITMSLVSNEKYCVSNQQDSVIPHPGFVPLFSIKGTNSTF